MKGRTSLFLMIFLLFFPVLSPAQEQLPDTGQTKFYDNSVEIPRPQPGEAFYGQDASYTIKPPSYTKLDAEGDDLPDSAKDWVMVRDNVTGLIWENKQNKNGVKNYADPHDADNTYTWYDFNPVTNGGKAGTAGTGTDTKDFIDALNAERFGGFSDWRLPTVKELQSVVYSIGLNPSINLEYFSGIQTYRYWSSTPRREGYPDFAVYVSFLGGYISYDYKSDDYYAVAVRGEQLKIMNDSIISGRMKDNGDGTITDRHTGLMWQKQDHGNIYSWESALNYCEMLTLAGYKDWRLPNVKELASIVDLTKYQPENGLVFSKIWSSIYWSSTTGWSSWNNPDNSENAWGVYFYDGSLTIFDSKLENLDVRAVRDGQTDIFPGDFEPDGDVDGKDIAGFASQLSAGAAAMSLEEFANVFGK